MKPYVITISRQFASMGRTIAQKMSNELGIEFLDRDIVAETANRMGLTIHDVSHHEESGEGSFFMRKQYLFNFSAYNVSDEIFMVQKSIIQDFAKKGSCIIVGRCADSILKDYDNVLNIYVYAPFEERLHNCTHELMMDEKTAISKIKKVDAARLAYRERYCPEVKSELDHRHIMIDSSRFGIDTSAEILVDIAKKTVMR